MYKLSVKMDKFERLAFHERADELFKVNGLPYPSTKVGSYRDYTNRTVRELSNRMVCDYKMCAKFEWSSTVDNPIDKATRDSIIKLCCDNFGIENNITHIFEYNSLMVTVSSRNTDNGLGKGEWSDGVKGSKFCILGGDCGWGEDPDAWAYLLVPEGKDIEELCEEWLGHECTEVNNSDNNNESFGGRTLFRYVPDQKMFLTWLERDHGVIELQGAEYA